MRDVLKDAGLSTTEHVEVGVPGETIARISAQHDCDLIVMGTRGLGSHAGLFLGSVARETLEHAQVPVLMVK